MINDNFEIISSNNPFLFDEITEDKIGASTSDLSAYTGDIVCITPLYDELIRRFGSYENAKFIYGFANDAIIGGNYASYPIQSTPYLDFTIYLDQTIIDEGILSPYVSKWIPGKKYYLGDTVYYSIDGSDENIKTYKLVSGDTTETTEIPFSVYEANSGITGDTYSYFESNSKYYVKTSFYRGYYSEKTKLTYFDSLNSNGDIELEHWKEDVTNNTNDSILYSGITGTTESLLQNVMRKRTDMDVSGNTLPFILHYNDTYDPSTGKKNGRELDANKTETFYMCGNMNMDYNFNTETVVSDVLESVTFYNSNSVPESGISFTEVNVPIIITSGKEAYTDEDDIKSIADCNMAQFIYYLSATLEKEEGTNNWVRKENTGVKYTENRPMFIQTDDFAIEEEDGTSILNLTYIVVNSNTQYNINYNNIDIFNSLRSNVNYSTVTVSESQMKDDYFLKTKVFKDESTMGIQNTIMNLDVNIERGIAESFQKHNMLGEICTLQDLENYKNGRYLE